MIADLETVKQILELTDELEQARDMERGKEAFRMRLRNSRAGAT